MRRIWAWVAPIAFGLCVVAVAPLWTQAQQPSGDSLERDIAALERMLTVLTREAKPRDWAGTQQKLGNAYRDRIRGDRADNLEKAIAAYEAALTAFTRATSPQDWAKTQNNLGNAYRDRIRGDPVDNLGKAIAAYQQGITSNRPEVAQLNNLAKLYQDQGRFAEAEVLYKRGLAINEAAFGSAHLNVATSLNNLAILYQGQGRLAEAEPLYRRAFAIYDKTLGPEHPNVGTSLDNLAMLYQGQGRLAEAEPLYRRALAVYEKSLGPEHPNVATSLNNLAMLYQDQGRLVDAEPLYRRALAIYEKSLGPEHPSIVAKLNNNLASLLQATNRFAEAEPLYHRALAIDQKFALNSDCVQRNLCTAVRILFGTDRVRADQPKRLGFGWDRAKKLQLGSAIVTVPRVRKRGEVNRPGWLDRLLGTPSEGDPAQHFTIPNGGVVTFETTADFIKRMQAWVSKGGEFKGHAVIFVHGYNTSFDDALYRAAQITYDLGTRAGPFGTMFVYSWPSAASEAAYIYDLESANFSVSNLVEFVELVTQQSGAKHVHVIAHSMGSAALLGALEEMTAPTSASPLIDQLILAAPDVDAARFEEIASQVSHFAKATTLYASANDVAMIAARKFRLDKLRAGDVSPAGPVVAPGVESIDVSVLSTDIFSSHSQYAERRELLNDVGLLFRYGVHPPHKRNIGYRQRGEGARTYWRYAE